MEKIVEKRGKGRVRDTSITPAKALVAIGSRKPGINYDRGVHTTPRRGNRPNYRGSNFYSYMRRDLEVLRRTPGRAIRGTRVHTITSSDLLL
jgi:hypothetical protein